MAFRNFEKLRSILQCPQCDSTLKWTCSGVVCSSCKQEIRLLDSCIVFISEDLPPSFDQPDYASTNPYTWDSLQLIEQYKDGIVLDLGAGKPDHDFPNVIQLEIRKYTGTDIVITEGKLPLKDNSVDGIISESVLEHVQNPFLYVSEIYRVLKPNGPCVINAAFLQPLHGAPHHFFNTTHHALELLFSGFKLDTLQVGPHQHPWITLRWFLQSYINGMLSEEDRNEFRNQTVGELEQRLLTMHDKRTEIKKNPNIYRKAYNVAHFNQDHADELGALLRITPETEIELAAGFELIGKKDSSNTTFLEKWNNFRAKNYNLLRAHKFLLQKEVKHPSKQFKNTMKQKMKKFLYKLNRN